MPKHLDEPPCDLHKIPSCESIEWSNSGILSNMADVMEQIRNMLQEISKALPPREEVMHDVPNLDLKDSRIIINHPK